VEKKKLFDPRLIYFKTARRLLYLGVITVVVLLFVADVASIKTTNMTPTLRMGDRILYTKGIFSQTYEPGDVVLYRHRNEGHVFAGRIAARGGDTLSISQGIATNNNSDSILLGSLPDTLDILPILFGPRDELGTLWMPRQNQQIVPDSFPLHHRILLANYIRRENPRHSVRIAAAVKAKEEFTTDYFIKTYTKYEGPLTDIPDSLQFDPYFWLHLEQYLLRFLQRQDSVLQVWIEMDDQRLRSYKLSKQPLFILSDNWDGHIDSRYFGWIPATHIEGHIRLCLYSITKARGFDFSRIGKIIH